MGTAFSNWHRSPSSKVSESSDCIIKSAPLFKYIFNEVYGAKSDVPIGLKLPPVRSTLWAAHQRVVAYGENDRRPDRERVGQHPSMWLGSVRAATYVNSKTRLR